MNKKQEECIAYGLFLLINNSDKLKESEKKVWNMDYEDSYFNSNTDDNIYMEV